MNSTALLRPLLFATAVAALPLGSLAQPAALAPGQVSGAELQAWIDADGFAVGGITLANGCVYLAKGAPKRYQTVHCGSSPVPFTVIGDAEVVGNRICARFVYPGGNKYEACQDIVKVGDNKYEARVDGVVRNVIYRLVP